MADRGVTTLPPEVAAFLDYKRSGDYIPHSWVKHIGVTHTTKRKGKLIEAWRSRPHAQRLLARVVWAYSPTPVKNGSGDVTRWKKKFSGPYWVLNTREMCEALGCGRKTLITELNLLKELGLVRTQSTKRGEDNVKAGAPIYVIPVVDEIKRISSHGQPAKVLRRKKAETCVETTQVGGCVETTQVKGERVCSFYTGPCVETTHFLSTSPIPLSLTPETGARAPEAQSNGETPKGDGKPKGDFLNEHFKRMERMSPDIRALTDEIPDEAIRAFAIEIHKLTSLRVCGAAKQWATGAREAYEAAAGRFDLIPLAVAKLRKDRLTIAGPYSLVKTLASLEAETRTEAKAVTEAAAMVQIETAGGTYFVEPDKVAAFCAERGLPLPEGF